jgi:hypothetical protein
MNELEQKNLLQTEAQISDELSAEDLEKIAGGADGGLFEALGELVGEVTQVPVKVGAAINGAISDFGEGFDNAWSDW